MTAPRCRNLHDPTDVVKREWPTKAWMLNYWADLLTWQQQQVPGCMLCRRLFPRRN